MLDVMFETQSLERVCPEMVTVLLPRVDGERNVFDLILRPSYQFGHGTRCAPGWQVVIQSYS